MINEIDYSKLARQSLCRPLSEQENSLALALEQIFAAQIHDFARVAEELNNRRVERPSGEKSPWTQETLEVELKRINEELDIAYDVCLQTS